MRQRVENQNLYKEEVLLEKDFYPWPAGEFEGGVHVRWIGDLDLDGKVDILMTIQDHYACWDVVLLLSSRATGNSLVGEAARYGACGC